MLLSILPHAIPLRCLPGEANGIALALHTYSALRWMRKTSGCAGFLGPFHSSFLLPKLSNGCVVLLRHGPGQEGLPGAVPEGALRLWGERWKACTASFGGIARACHAPKELWEENTCSLVSSGFLHLVGGIGLRQRRWKRLKPGWLPPFSRKDDTFNRRFGAGTAAFDVTNDCDGFRTFALSDVEVLLLQSCR
jgi:hypothetical protein